MKAPDKIYVLHPTDGILPNAMYGTAWLLSSNYKNEVEYIRKDALLEWAKKEMGKWSSESNTAQGVKMGLTLVIDKIETL